MTSSTTSSTLRTLHLVDLENLIGDPHADAPTALATFAAYLDVARWLPDDHVIIATNPWMMGKIVFDLPVPASPHAVHGHDGADLMLLSLSPPEWVAKRFDRLVIGSGDWIFANRAQTVSDRGVMVDVIARPDRCSAQLRRFACWFITPPADVALAA
jgi:hypothetical protein